MLVSVPVPHPKSRTSPGETPYFSNKSVKSEFSRLMDDYEMLRALSEQTEKIRFEVMKKFGRI